MPGPWEKYQTKPQSAGGPWEKYRTIEVPVTPPMTGLESAALGALQSASLGTADEIEAGAKAAYDTAFGDTKLADIASKYRSEREPIRARYEKARQDNPASYTAGEIGGGIASTLIPGIGLAKGASLGSKLLTAGAYGAASGLGTSTADLTKGDIGNAAEDTLWGAGTGAVTQGALSGLGAAAKGLTPTNLAKKGANVFLGAPEEITETYLKNPEGVKAAQPIYRVATDAGKTLDQLKNEVVEGSAQSRAILDSEGRQVPASQLGKVYDHLADQLEKRSEGVWDDPQKYAAYKWLRDTAAKFKPQASELEAGLEGPVQAPVDKALSTNKVKDVLQGIDRQTDWETAPGKFSRIDDSTKKAVRGEIDAILKGESPAYAKQMEGVAKDAALHTDVSQFATSPERLTNIFKRTVSDQTGTGQIPVEALKQFDERMGTNFLEQAKLSAAKQAFDRSVTNGSRNVNMFTNMLKDVPVIKHLAPVVGGTVDKYGRQMTMGAVDTAAYLSKLYRSDNVQKFMQDAAPFIDQARKGNPAAILTFQLLSQSNPEALQYLDKGPNQ